jgi:hypothetical protein
MQKTNASSSWIWDISPVPLGTNDSVTLSQPSFMIELIIFVKSEHFINRETIAKIPNPFTFKISLVSLTQIKNRMLITNTQSPHIYTAAPMLQQNTPLSARNFMTLLLLRSNAATNAPPAF